MVDSFQPGGVGRTTEITEITEITERMTVGLGGLLGK